jgi:hypothetical protein
VHYDDYMRHIFHFFCHPVDLLQNVLLNRSLLREQKALTRRLQEQRLRSAEDLNRLPISQRLKNRKHLS